MQRKAIVIGATGLVGQHLVKQLSELYDTLIVIARRPPRYINSSMRFYQVNDFDNLAEIFASVGADNKTDAFSCLGTTKKQAGSDEAFRKIDHDYNVSHRRRRLPVPGPAGEAPHGRVQAHDAAAVRPQHDQRRGDEVDQIGLRKFAARHPLRPRRRLPRPIFRRGC